MGFNTSSKAINCWNCGKQSLIETLSELLNVPDHKARGFANSLFLNREDTFEKYEKQTKTGSLKLPNNLKELHPAHKKYLLSRHFKPKEIVKTWDIQGIGISARLAWRIFIPIKANGKTVSWTTRSISNKVKQRYISASREEETIPHFNLLYGEDYCKHACIVHEGPIDAWRTGPGAVATMGLVVTSNQLKRISSYPLRVICFDSSTDAQNRADDLCDNLENYDGETINVTLETGKDIAEADESEVKELRKFLR